MKEAAAEISYPARPGDLTAWFAERYPDVKSTTVRAHVKGLTENDSSRHHYASLARREPLFTRSHDGALMPFDATAAGDAEDDDVDLDDAEVEEGDLEFALEAYLEEFLLTNFDRIEWGRPLQLWESDEGELGHQYVTDVGRLDFLCRDTADDTLVVIELKRGRPSDRVVGQAARYMGWVRANLARAARAGADRCPRTRGPARLRGRRGAGPLGSHLPGRLPPLGASAPRRHRVLTPAVHARRSGRAGPGGGTSRSSMASKARTPAYLSGCRSPCSPRSRCRGSSLASVWGWTGETLALRGSGTPRGREPPRSPRRPRTRSAA